MKKLLFAEEEIPIIDEACIFKRAKYWQFLQRLPQEIKYILKSLCTHSAATVIETGKAVYLKIYTNLQHGKTYFSITIKEGSEKYLNFRLRDFELGHIIKTRHIKIANRVHHFLCYIVKETKLKELKLLCKEFSFTTAMLKSSLAEGRNNEH